jgi:hypothetical protein
VTTDVSMFSLPSDIQSMIYRSYFSEYVLPGMKERSGALAVLGDNCPLSTWRLLLQEALSKANMYRQGKINITRLCARDQHWLFSELMEYNPQIHMCTSRTYITTQANRISYNEIANTASPRLEMCSSGRYILLWPPFDQSSQGQSVGWDHLTHANKLELHALTPEAARNHIL